MADNPFTLHRRAQIAINELLPSEAKQVMAALKVLMRRPSTEWRPSRARPFPSDPSLYLVQVNPSLRAIVRVAEGQPYEVLDVVRRETLDSFVRAAAESEDRGE